MLHKFEVINTEAVLKIRQYNNVVTSIPLLTKKRFFKVILVKIFNSFWIALTPKNVARNFSITRAIQA